MVICRPVDGVGVEQRARAGGGGQHDARQVEGAAVGEGHRSLDRVARAEAGGVHAEAVAGGVGADVVEGDGAAVDGLGRAARGVERREGGAADAGDADGGEAPGDDQAGAGRGPRAGASRASSFAVAGCGGRPGGWECVLHRSPSLVASGDAGGWVGTGARPVLRRVRRRCPQVIGQSEGVLQGVGSDVPTDGCRPTGRWSRSGVGAGSGGHGGCHEQLDAADVVGAGVGGPVGDEQVAVGEDAEERGGADGGRRAPGRCRRRSCWCR